MAGVDRYEGRCWLDWWANPSTNLAGTAVSVAITSASTGWDARARLIDPAARSGLAFLVEIDPVFLLRFSDAGAIPVTVDLTHADHVTLTEYPGTEHRPTRRPTHP